MSGYANGVSLLHGDVSRDMWQFLWPDTPSPHVPIGHITNGVHVQTWLAPELQRTSTAVICRTIGWSMPSNPRRGMVSFRFRTQTYGLFISSASVTC